MKSLSRRMRGWGRAWHLHFTVPVGQLLGASWRRTMQWCGGMKFRLFLQGLPALAAGVGLLLLTAFSLMAPAYEVETRYLEQGRIASQAKDYPLALTCFERVCAQGGDRPEVLYEMALTAEAMGQRERAALLMRQLAPLDKQGYGDAHLWHAVRLLQGTQTATVLKAAEAHLLRALQGEVKNREFVHGLLGDVYLVTGQLDQAEEHLLKGASRGRISGCAWPVSTNSAKTRNEPAERPRWWPTIIDCGARRIFTITTPAWDWQRQ